MALNRYMGLPFLAVLTFFIFNETRASFQFPNRRFDYHPEIDPAFDYRPQIDPGFAPVRHFEHLTRRDKSENDILWNEIAEEIESLRTSGFAAKKSKFVCPEHFGDFPDPEDCSSYYTCMFKNSKSKKCRGSMRFDKISNKCTDKDKAKCAGKDDNDEHQKINFKCRYAYGPHTHPTDCSKFFLCLFSKPALKLCDPGQLYDEKERKCLDADEVDCGSRFNPYDTTTTITTKATKKTIKTKKPETTTQLTTTTTSQQPITPVTTSSTISGEDTSPTITEENTSPTITEEVTTPTITEEVTTPTITEEVTSSTITEEVTSPTITEEVTTPTITEEVTTPTITEEVTSSTITEEVTTPTITEVTSSTITEVVTTPTITDKETPTTLQPTESPEPEFVCPERKGKYPYDKDCSKYYNCKAAKATLANCGQGTLFDEVQGICYDGSQVDCGERKRPDQITVPQTTVTVEQSTVEPGATSTIAQETESTVAPETESTVAPETSSSVAPETTSSVATETTYSLEPETPSSIAQETPSSLAPETPTSLEPETSSSVAPETPSTLEPETPSTVTPETESTVTSETEPTNPPSTVPTPEPKEEKEEFVCPTGKGKFPYDKDCSKYYNCKAGNATLVVCAEGTLFHQNYSFCYNAKDVDCGNRKRPEEGITDGPHTDDIITGDSSASATLFNTISIIAETNTVFSTSEPDTCDGNDKTCNKDKSGLILRCPEPNGIFPHPTDKTMFIQCDHSKIYIQKCAGNLVFNPAIKGCDWP